MRDLLLIGSGIILGSLYFKIKKDLDTHRDDLEKYIEFVVEDLNDTITDIQSGIELAIDESDDFKRKMRNNKAML